MIGIGILLIILAAGIILVPRYVMQRTIVYGESMEPALIEGDSVMIDKLFYKISGLKRFDIIRVFPYGKEANVFYIKRVVGMPGETVQIKDSVIYIDGEPLAEPYGKEDVIEDEGIAAKPVKLGKKEYFVMGDNRNDSEDSRSEGIGPVSSKYIDGRAFIRVWPKDRLGKVE
ncbi:signal peptidase I [Anaerolentibacter hominis]|uniref:signal peptidase I n=1 Tax=Anaerolentibacter hominis TaxID=3079009 RepID=UPI0031B8A0BE